ncbi:MAG: hypothetical protein ACD_58C00306G0003 [uncultured bacterium]|nr:MAG: hypothetical protein ACD_58C00306G0003 [uncultured bacterium]
MIYLYILLVLVIILLLIAYIFSLSMIHPYRQKITKTPADYGMNFEDVEFPATDGVKIRGWLVKPKKLTCPQRLSQTQACDGGRDKLIIQTHPMPFNRAGFNAKNQGPINLFKEDVDLLKTTRALNNVGYWVLTIDLRNCGESGSGITAVGLNEWQDVTGALDYIKSRKDLAHMDIGFASFCMGANATIIATSKAPDKLKNVKCAMLVQPISMLVFLRTFVKNTFTALSLPILPIMEFFARLGGSPKFAEESPIEYAKSVKFPTLLIQGKFDKWTELADTQKIFDNLAGEKELNLIEKPMPRFEVYNLVGGKPDKMLEFFRKYL